ncbi:hypothetical protein HT585_27890 [Ensifer sp. HO-A22]|uniref:Uncharacterized protein n=1 Tax=Ensifer oleiphilus TaxID=2742698 RepID=A0A7Y6QBQ5_9HYPH|nr:hypothetical protein [Ensifer oleiphilus]NVD42699.1 hypothetical protein [Ensifer oleiphilus]
MNLHIGKSLVAGQTMADSRDTHDQFRRSGDENAWRTVGSRERPSKTAVLTLNQIAFSAENRPINILISVHHPKRYPLSIQQGE